MTARPFSPLRSFARRCRGAGDARHLGQAGGDGRVALLVLVDRMVVAGPTALVAPAVVPLSQLALQARGVPMCQLPARGDRCVRRKESPLASRTAQARAAAQLSRPRARQVWTSEGESVLKVSRILWTGTGLTGCTAQRLLRFPGAETGESVDMRVSQAGCVRRRR